MAKIKLNLDENALYVNKKGYMAIKVDPTSTIQVLKDGLYVPAPPGKKGNPGTPYPDEKHMLVGIGKISPFDDYNSQLNSYQYRVNLMPSIHRIFEADNATGANINIRQGPLMGDYVLPGDFFRVRDGENYNYYLVTSTTGGEDSSKITGVKTSVFIVSVPITAKLCINDKV